MENITREEMEADVVIVGGGSAGLSCAIHLHNLIKAKNESGGSLAEPMIVVLEKASEIGAHSLSGAVLNPVSLKEMIPNYMEMGCPIEVDVEEEAFYFFGPDFSVQSPVIPPPFKNHGNHIVSVAKLNRWLGKQAEEKGINVFAGFTAVEALYDDNNKVIGVRTGDRGLDKDGKPKSNFEPGMLIKSKLTVFADGTNSPLFKRVCEKLDLRKGKNKEVFELGVKEIIQLPKGRVKPGKVIHTLGFPFKHTIGGTFIYTLPDDQVIVGLCAYLDTVDPLLDVHKLLQRLKTHKWMRNFLQGGEVISYGAKTLPAGGWLSMPKLYHDGMLVCGDSASMVDVKKLKGIHLAMKSGMLAAETAILALEKNDFSQSTLKVYEEKVSQSVIKEDLWKTRNFHQTLSKGIMASAVELGIQEFMGGFAIGGDKKIDHYDRETTETCIDVWGPESLSLEENQLPPVDNKLFFDKLSSVYMTGTFHDEDSPNHLILQNGNICSDVCAPQFNSPCNHFCPANVYEMINKEGSSKKTLQINYTNCIHCQSCDIKCPFNNIDWTLPEATGGPNYKVM